MTTVMVVGDTHADLEFAKAMNRLAYRNGINTIFQVGDFGYWPRMVGPGPFTDALGQDSFDKQIVWIFIPGNHEDWDSLDEVYKYGVMLPNGTVEVADNIFYAGKTNGFMFEDKKIMVAGGAYSIDKDFREAGLDWFTQETLSEKDLFHLGQFSDTYSPADILFTHDAPTWADFGPQRLFPIPESDQHRQAMDVVYEMAMPRLWFHGHYHRWMNYYNDKTEVYGLDCNYGRGGYFHPSVVAVEMNALQVMRFTWEEIYGKQL